MTINTKITPSEEEIMELLWKEARWMTIREMMDHFKKNGKYPYKAKIVWVDSELPFFVPVSRRAFVVSVALQDSIIDFGEVFLLRNFPENSYNQAILYSRKCLLLTFIGYKISLRFLELWAVFF